MLSLHTNNAALSAQSSISRTQSNLSTSMTRLSTGFRINSAMDDAAGLQIATRLKAQSSGMAVAMRNTQNATSMMQTAEGALAEASNILVRMKDLATQAADASANDSDKTAMQPEYDALASELTNIIGNTSFGGAKLLNSQATADDLLAAQGKTTDAGTAHTNATNALGIGHTTPGVPGGAAPTGGSGARGAYETAVWNYDEATTGAAKTTAFEAMVAAKATLDKAEETFAKTQTGLDAATKYEAIVQDYVLDAGKLGGQLGGLAKYETEKLVPLQTGIGDMASQIASKVNAQLVLGYKADGVAGPPVTASPGEALFVFTPGGGADMLKVAGTLEAADLAFSADGNPGDTGNLQKLVAIKSQSISVTSIGTVLLSDADAQLVGKLGVDSQLNKAALKTTQTVRTQSVDDWQSTSGVNQDEEAVNLVEYQNMYQANMKVIAIANQLFDATLAMMG